MRLSRFPLFTTRETPADAEVVSHRLMLRAGMIRKLAAGLYTWTPLGLQVLRKVENIVREEMNAAGALELLMPAIQPAELWRESGRWDAMGAEMLRIRDRHEREFCFGPTHEEVITDLVRRDYRSYRQLPVNLYQIQTKFRDEIRPRFGVMRAREFLMKDAYSFHMDTDDLGREYANMRAAYTRIFERIGADFRIVDADPGAIGGSKSEEFHVLAQSGEDALLVSDTGDYAANVEFADLRGVRAGDPSPDGKGTLQVLRGIEVGHIFQLGRKYSESMNLTVLDEAGREVTPEMGCYGIGISRIVAAAIEQGHDDDGIVWPRAIAPFELIILPIKADKSRRVREAAEALYRQCLEAGVEAILDDRGLRPGPMFADADLIGIPHRIVVGERALDEGKLEYKARAAAETEHIDHDVRAVLEQIR